MSGLDTALARNAAAAAAGAHHGATVMPALRLLVVACIDPRCDPAHLLRLAPGDAFVVRTAGGRVTPEVVSDVAFIARLAALAVPEGPLFEVAIVHHTQCGTAALADDALRAAHAAQVGLDDRVLAARAVTDPHTSAVADAALLRGVLSARCAITPLVHDVETGLIGPAGGVRPPARRAGPAARG